jgi:hypothetical protein
MIDGTLDPARYRWKQVAGRCGVEVPDCARVPDPGLRPPRPHIVLAGEQHLWDVERDGSIGKHRFRRAGEYALTGNDQKPHLERGGDHGGLICFGARPDSPEIYAELNVVAEIETDPADRA